MFETDNVEVEVIETNEVCEYLLWLQKAKKGSIFKSRELPLEMCFYKPVLVETHQPVPDLFVGFALLSF